MVKHFAVLASACLLCFASSRARADPSAASPPQAHFRLDNGLDVLIEENHREPHVAVTVSYDVGSRDEPRGYSSLAHLVEHLTYRRSRHLGDYAALELLERAGVENTNGVTSFDRTLYYAVVPSKALPLALWLESERMGFTLEAFDAAAVRHERDVVRAELHSKATGFRRFKRHVIAALYGEEHPYPVALDAERDLDALGLRDAQWFFQQGYRPDNAHVVVVGDVTLGEGRALVERYFGGLVAPSRPLARRAPPAPSRPTPSRITYLSPELSSYFIAAYRAPAQGTPGHLAAEVLVGALRLLLGPKLVDQNRIASYLDVDLFDTAADSLFWLEAAPRQGVRFATLENALQAALAAVTPERLADAMTEARAGLLEREWLTLEDPLARASAHVEALAVTGQPRDSAARLRALRALTPAELAPLLQTFSKPLVLAEKAYDAQVDAEGAVEPSKP